MANQFWTSRPPRYSTSFLFCYAFQVLLFFQPTPTPRALCYQYKVGDLDSWGVPTSADQNVYNNWPQYHNFKLGDSLWFLYPPSQDSVIQVTAESYSSCNLKDPIMYTNDGNSLFNMTWEGVFYFTSGEPGHCEKGQRLQISLPANGSSSTISNSTPYPDGPPSSAATSPYPITFGSIPTDAISSSSSSLQMFSVSTASFIGSTILIIHVMIYA